MRLAPASFALLLAVWVALIAYEVVRRYKVVQEQRRVARELETTSPREEVAA